MVKQAGWQILSANLRHIIRRKIPDGFLLATVFFRRNRWNRPFVGRVRTGFRRIAGVRAPVQRQIATRAIVRREAGV